MTCLSVRPLIEAHLDGELDANQQVHIREHLESCASCNAAYERLQRLHAGIRSHAPYFRAPESLALRVAASVRKAGKAQRLPRAWAWQWLAAAASVALVISLAANFALMRARPGANQLLAREVLSGHARSMLGAHLVDVASSDRHTVKPWFSGKLDFSPDVKDLAGKGFPLSGGRVDYLAGRPVAALVFHRAQHVINLFTWPSAQAGPGEVSENGYHVVSWTHDGMIYCAVSDLNLDELKLFARLYRE